MRRLLGWTVAALVILFLALQWGPYGRRPDNPPVRMEPRWNSPGTRALAVRACFDCHSNETVWPWYASVAPLSWLLRRDVVEGRRELNFSEWDRPQKEGRESAKVMRKGEMPPWFYLMIQRKARLTAGETEALIEGLAVTLGGSGEGKRPERGSD